ncbi:MAG: AraC family transcriptional regulator [Bacteroidales bacterium]|nr:AraC family transcriptional regulator [Bacteroidales bacterium]
MTYQGNRFYKYLTIGEDDKRWGIYLTGAGHIKVEKNTEYPLVDDPSHHYFHWTTGRRLSEYQILFITKGQGLFESEMTSIRKVNAGDIFILFPDIWHRFKPDKATGWDEYWIEFDGEIIKHFRNMEFLNPNNPVIAVGLQEEIAENYLKILKLIKDEKPGFQYIASGILIQILGQLFASRKYHLFEGKIIENKIRQAKLIIMENVNTPISQEDIAGNIGMGYSLYRKKFKEYTGVSPTQYQIQLKINKAKDLLITSNQTLKEIAYNLGFEFPDYFYRLFKQKTGITPSDFREKNIR